MSVTILPVASVSFAASFVAWSHPTRKTRSPVSSVRVVFFPMRGVTRTTWDAFPVADGSDADSETDSETDSDSDSEMDSDSQTGSGLEGYPRGALPVGRVASSVRTTRRPLPPR